MVQSSLYKATPAYKAFLSDTMTLTSDLEKQQASFSHNDDQLYQVV